MDNQFTVIDQPTYSLSLPEGWSVLSEDEREAMVFKGDNPAQLLENPWLLVKVSAAEGASLEADYNEAVEQMGATPVADVAIGGAIYKACTLVEHETESLILIGEQGESRIVITISNASADDSDVQQIVGSVKAK